MSSKSFKEYLRSFEYHDDSTFDWVEFVDLFGREIHENPKNFSEFFDVFNDLFEKIIPEISHKIRGELTLEYLAGMSVLVDYDDNRRLSESFLKSETDFWKFLSIYDNPKNYGFVMKEFSRFIGLEGELLKEFICGMYTAH